MNYFSVTFHHKYWTGFYLRHVTWVLIDISLAFVLLTLSRFLPSKFLNFSECIISFWTVFNCRLCYQEITVHSKSRHFFFIFLGIFPKFCTYNGINDLFLSSYGTVGTYFLHENEIDLSRSAVKGAVGKEFHRSPIVS